MAIGLMRTNAPGLVDSTTTKGTMKPQTQAPVVAHKCRDCGGTHDVTPTGSPMDCLRYWRTRAITSEVHCRKSNAALVEACQYAAELLAKIPAFGDSIGEKVNKAQLGIAHNRLMNALTADHQRALEAAHGTKEQHAIDRAIGPDASDEDRQQWLRTHNSNTGKPL